MILQYLLQSKADIYAEFEALFLAVKYYKGDQSFTFNQKLSCFELAAVIAGDIFDQVIDLSFDIDKKDSQDRDPIELLFAMPPNVHSFLVSPKDLKVLLEKLFAKGFKLFSNDPQFIESKPLDRYLRRAFWSGSSSIERNGYSLLRVILKQVLKEEINRRVITHAFSHWFIQKLPWKVVNNNNTFGFLKCQSVLFPNLQRKEGTSLLWEVLVAFKHTHCLVNDYRKKVTDFGIEAHVLQFQRLKKGCDDIRTVLKHLLKHGADVYAIAPEGKQNNFSCFDFVATLVDTERVFPSNGGPIKEVFSNWDLFEDFINAPTFDPNKKIGEDGHTVLSTVFSVYNRVPFNARMKMAEKLFNMDARFDAKNYNHKTPLDSLAELLMNWKYNVRREEFTEAMKTISQWVNSQNIEESLIPEKLRQNEGWYDASSPLRLSQ